MEKASQGPLWLDLFDTFQMEHVCKAVRVAINNLAVGEPTAIADLLRQWVLVPLDAYLADRYDPAAKGRSVDVDAAQSLFDKVERAAEHLEDRFPFCEGDGEVWATGLRTLWVEFIAAGAAPYVELAHRLGDNVNAEAPEALRNAVSSEVQEQTPARRSEADKELMRKLRRAGFSDAKIAAKFKISRPRVSQVIGTKTANKIAANEAALRLATG